jgi:RNA polymerase sigma factor (sigma-70 family)
MTELRVIKGGRSQAERFEQLIRPLYDVLYRVAFRLTRDESDAEDLVQEACVRGFARFDELESHADPRAWLILVMRRVYIDQGRRYERRNVESMETTQAVMQADGPGPAEAVDGAVRFERLDRAWRFLDAEQRSLLALHDIEGYSLAELVEMTGTKEGTLKSRLHRARVKLGRLMQAEPDAAVPALKKGVVQ